MHSGDVGETELRAEVGRSRVVVEIRDRGCGFDARRFDAGAVPDPLVSHGRGLFLIHRLMDEVEVRSSERRRHPRAHGQDASRDRSRRAGRRG